jgi:hypothetical protein
VFAVGDVWDHDLVLIGALHRGPPGVPLH